MITSIEGRETPAIISYFHMMGILQAKYPGFYHISGRMWEKAKIDFPEYFADEISREKLYDSVPKEVHDAYHNEIMTVFPIIPGKGIWYWIEHPDEHQKWREEMASKVEENEIKGDEIWDKHYKPYGLEKLK